MTLEITDYEVISPPIEKEADGERFISTDEKEEFEVTVDTV